MKQKTTILIIGAICALIVVYGSAALSRALGAVGSDAWILRSGLSMLGLAAIGLVVWYLLKRAATAGDAAPTAPDEIDVAFASARERLAASKIAGAGSFGSMPIVLVMGPDGAAKTTVVARSGLEPELLAGEGAQGDAIAPTRSANVWYAGGTIFVEAGGQIAATPTRWARIIRHLQPQRLGAVFAAGQQAPRSALVCFSCERFLEAGSAEAVPAAAQALRARLGELSEQLGIRLPVYVLFTKADRIPHFAEYVQNFSREETQQVVGTTLPAEIDAPIGSYGDRETGRISAALADIVRSLADKRLMVLGREHAPERRPGAYEFPREVRKIVPLVTRFLVELCKPSQLHSSPFLRGFYFTGVQAVVITDAAPSPMAQQPATARAGAAIDATSVFQSRSPVAAAAPVRPLGAPTTRKVPRWLFLDRVFRDVILADRAAQDVTRGGTRVNLLRRVALGAGVAAAALLAIAFTVSYAGNRSLERRTVAAAAALPLVPASNVDLPSLEALASLDSLRARVAELRDHALEGAPLHLSWGLYGGDELLEPARMVYFRNFDRLMFRATRDSMASALAALPQAPTPEHRYGETYDLLKAHLITTVQPTHSTVEFLPPVLMRSWLSGRMLDSARAELARRQMQFYASELAIDNPFPSEPDPATIAHARTFLTKFTEPDQIYRAMIDEAGRTNRAVNFNGIAPGSGVLVVGHEVPGAYTTGGWAFVHGALKNVNQLFKAEPWVMGDQSGPRVDEASVVEGLRTRYVADYRREWQTFLRSASVPPFGGLRDAAQKLGALSTGTSPMLTLFSVVAQNTSVDSTMAEGFQPVHLVTPPAVTDKLVNEANKPYIDALMNLRGAVEQVANAPPSPQGPDVAPITAQATTARNATQQIGQNFKVDRDARVGTTVLALMEAPINNVQTSARVASTPDLNAAGRTFCGALRELMVKFPFDQGASQEATFPEVAAVFAPGSGALWRMWEHPLQRSLERQGSRFVQRPGAPAVSPAFIDFFTKAVAASEALYPEGGTSPRVPFSVKPFATPGVAAIAFSLDAQPPARFTQANPPPAAFTWSGPGSAAASLSANINRDEVTIASGTGPWAIFRLFERAEQFTRVGNDYRVTWPVRINGQTFATRDGTPVKVVLDVSMGPTPIFQGGFFSSLRRCPDSVAR